MSISGVTPDLLGEYGFHTLQRISKPLLRMALQITLALLGMQKHKQFCSGSHINVTSGQCANHMGTPKGKSRVTLTC